MSRRQTDLEPGVEPDTGEPESFGAPNGRPPTPAAGVASRHPPPGRPARRPARPTTGRPANGRRAERRPPTGGGSSPSLRWVPWIVLALIAAAFIVSSLAGGSSSKTDLTYSQFVEPGRRRQRQEHRLQQVDRRDQRQVRDAGQRQRPSSRARARRTTCPTRCSRRSTRRASTSTTSTRAATSSATSCCGCCRSS